MMNSPTNRPRSSSSYSSYVRNDKYWVGIDQKQSSRFSHIFFSTKDDIVTVTNYISQHEFFTSPVSLIRMCLAALHHHEFIIHCDSNLYLCENTSKLFNSQVSRTYVNWDEPTNALKWRTRRKKNSFCRWSKEILSSDRKQAIQSIIQDEQRFLFWKTFSIVLIVVFVMKFFQFIKHSKTMFCLIKLHEITISSSPPNCWTTDHMLRELKFCTFLQIRNN